MRIKVGLVGNRELESTIEGSNDFEVSFNVDNGLQAVEAYGKKGADVIITELSMPLIDGFGLMEELKGENAPKFVIASNLKSEVFMLKAIENGAASYLIKPLDPTHLIKRLSATVKPTLRRVSTGAGNKTLDERLSSIFISVGIPAHIKGYQFLREGVKLAVNDPPIINSITKSLYPEIARRYDTTPSKVERAIRHAIEVAWNRGRIENINSLFGVKVYYNNERPTNGEFIALLADKMLLESIC